MKTDENGLPEGFAKAYDRAFSGQPADNKRVAACEEMWRAAAAQAATRALPAPMVVGDPRNPLRGPFAHDGYVAGWNAALRAVAAA